MYSHIFNNCDSNTVPTARAVTHMHRAHFDTEKHPFMYNCSFGQYDYSYLFLLIGDVTIVMVMCSLNVGWAHTCKFNDISKRLVRV